jgi:hypothetical protein
MRLAAAGCVYRATIAARAIPTSHTHEQRVTPITAAHRRLRAVAVAMSSSHTSEAGGHAPSPADQAPIELHVDKTLRAVVHTEDVSWVPSPSAGVFRRMIERKGGEVARATTIVRFEPHTQFTRHTHAGGEEFLVLDGVWRDDYGVFPKGSYIRNYIGSGHTPVMGDEGCTILVKLRQMDLGLPEPETRAWRTDPSEEGAVHWLALRVWFNCSAHSIAQPCLCSKCHTHTRTHTHTHTYSHSLTHTHTYTHTHTHTHTHTLTHTHTHSHTHIHTHTHSCMHGCQGGRYSQMAVARSRCTNRPTSVFGWSSGLRGSPRMSPSLPAVKSCLCSKASLPTETLPRQAATAAMACTADERGRATQRPLLVAWCVARPVQKDASCGTRLSTSTLPRSVCSCSIFKAEHLHNIFRWVGICLLNSLNETRDPPLRSVLPSSSRDRTAELHVNTWCADTPAQHPNS